MQGRSHAAEAAPTEAGGERASFDPGWDESRRAPGPTHSQGAFTSEDDIRIHLRVSGQVVFRSRPFRLPCRFPTSSGCPSLPGEDPRPKRWVVVADTTRVGQNFRITSTERPGVIHNVNTRVFHNCGYRVSFPETHRENTISPAPDHGPGRGRVDVHKKDVSASPRIGRCHACGLACPPRCRCPRTSCARQTSSLVDLLTAPRDAPRPPGQGHPGP